MTARRDAGLVKDVTQVAAASKLGTAQIVDARAPERFRGDAAEPRPGLRAGHIPGARNVHFTTLLNDDHTLKGDDALKAAFEDSGVDLGKPIITSCGSGVTACVNLLSLAALGRDDAILYGGSWSDWCSYLEAD